MENSSVSAKKIVLPYGLFLGLVLSLITILCYAFKIELLVKWWMSILQFVVILGFGIIAIQTVKNTKLEEQDFSFREAFTAYFIPVALGTFLAALVNYVLFNFIDPDAATYLLQHGIDQAREMMKNLGGSEEQLNKSIEALKNENQFSLKNQAIGYVFSLALYSVIGLLVALIFKRKTNNLS